MNHSEIVSFLWGVADLIRDTFKRDPKDGQVGLVGYEINFNRYFYRYTPPRPLEEIEAAIRAIEQDIVRMLAEVTGTSPGAESGHNTLIPIAKKCSSSSSWRGGRERNDRLPTSAVAAKCRRLLE